MEETARVLIVDDDPSVLYTLETLLTPEPYGIAFATSGSEALIQVKEFMPDIILLDVMMPEMTGLEVCQSLKSDSRWRHIPIILVTALNSREDLVRGLEIGADEFLTKPVNGPELRARVRSMLRIKQLYDEMQETMRLREKLANMIVHDMKSPLHTVILYADLLMNSDGSATHQQQFTSKIRAQAHRLNGMLTDMLVLAKMRAGQLIPNKKQVNINQLVEYASRDQIVVANSQGIEVELELPEKAFKINVDSDLIQRVIDNLLSNAIKFSPSGSQVILRLEAENPKSKDDGGSSASIRIIDQGEGMPEELHQNIFDELDTVPSDLAEVPQSGLGLAFCKLVVEAHAGRIFVEANKPAGSVFVIELPGI